MSELRYPGDIEIVTVNIKNTKGTIVNVTDLILSIDLFEDIFAPFNSGMCYIRDSQEISNLLPLIGEESIHFNLKTPGFDIEYQRHFAIYKMGDRSQVSDGNLGYKFFFMSKEGIIDQNVKISRAFSGLIVSDFTNDLSKAETCIVEKLLTADYALGNPDKKKIIIEKSDSKIKYVSNFWNPVQNLYYLVESTVSKDHTSPTYVFFENKHGLNYVSIAGLYKGVQQAEFIITKEVSGGNKDYEKDYKKVIEWHTPNVYDYMKRLQGGMYGSQIMSFDLTSKQYMHVAYTPPFESDQHLNESDNRSSKAPAIHQSAIFNSSKSFNNFDDFGDVTNTGLMQNRLGLMTQAESFKVEIIVYGRLDYTAGQVVYLKMPFVGQIPTGMEDVEDKMFSGKYIISALNHRIDRKKHLCIIELIKDSFKESTDNQWFDP